MAKVAAKKTRLKLRLYIAGSAPNSARAIGNVRAICAKHFSDMHDLEIVDMLEDPIRALADGIIVTPTLMKLAPLPTRTVIGNLTDQTRVLAVLLGS